MGVYKSHKFMKIKSYHRHDQTRPTQCEIRHLDEASSGDCHDVLDMQTSSSSVASTVV